MRSFPWQCFECLRQNGREDFSTFARKAKDARAACLHFNGIALINSDVRILMGENTAPTLGELGKRQGISCCSCRDEEYGGIMIEKFADFIRCRLAIAIVAVRGLSSLLVGFGNSCHDFRACANTVIATKVHQ